MRQRSVLLLAVVAVLVVACGSAAATPTRAPGAGGGGGGNKPAGWDNHGKVTYTLSGAATASGELGFVPAGSLFVVEGGFSGAQVSLNFFDDASQTLVALRLEGANAFVQYGDGKVTFASETCTTKNLKVELANASGSFECTGAVITESQAVVTGAKMTGTFTAKAL